MSWLARYLILTLIPISILWPNTAPSAVFFHKTGLEQFFILNLANYHIRFTEIVFGVLVIIALFKSFVMSTYIADRARCRYHKIIRYYLNMLLVGIALSAYGWINQNANVLSDIRIYVYTLAFPMFMSFFKRPEELMSVIKKLFLMILVGVFINLIVFWFKSKQPIGQTGRLPGMLALFLLSIAMAYFTHFQENRKKYATICILSTLPIIVSLEKWGLFGIAVALAGSFIIGYKGSKHNITTSFIVINVLILILLLVHFTPLPDMLAKSAGWSSFEHYYSVRVLHEDTLIGRDITGGRLTKWEVGVQEYFKHPIFGQGFGFRTFYWYDYMSEYAELREHNLILWILLRSGIIGLIISGILGIKFLKIGVTTYLAETNIHYKALVHGLLTFCFVFLTLCLFAMRIANFEEALLFWFCISAVLLMHEWQGKNYIQNTILQSKL